MRINWTPDNSSKCDQVEELLKIEYDFRKTLTKLLLSHSSTDKSGESELYNYEFNFNTITRKFSFLNLPNSDKTQVRLLTSDERTKHYFEV